MGVKTGEWTMAMNKNNNQCSNTVKLHLILFYLDRYIIKLLLTESSVHTGNICSDVQGALTLLHSVGPHALTSEKIFPHMDLAPSQEYNAHR